MEEVSFQLLQRIFMVPFIIIFACLYIYFMMSVLYRAVIYIMTRRGNDREFCCSVITKFPRLYSFLEYGLILALPQKQFKEQFGTCILLFPTVLLISLLIFNNINF